MKIIEFLLYKKLLHLSMNVLMLESETCNKEKLRLNCKSIVWDTQLLEDSPINIIPDNSPQHLRFLCVNWDFETVLLNQNEN